MTGGDLFGIPTKKRRTGMRSHQTADSGSHVWVTPPHVLEALGPFDLDPCACMEPRPWPTAAEHYTKADNGLLLPWRGRVWLNPPYGGPEVVGPWLARMSRHNRGIALIFARTETEAFQVHVWPHASALLFLAGRLFFHRPDGRRASANAGAPSVLIAYGDEDRSALQRAQKALPGALVDRWTC